MSYISRVNIISKFEKLKEKAEGLRDKLYLDGVLAVIECEPPADVVEAKHGEWIQEWELEKGLEDNDEIPYIKCSLCGHTEWCIDKERDATPNYCSDCGAKMKNGS